MKLGPNKQDEEEMKKNPGKTLLTLLLITIILLGGPIAWVIGMLLTAAGFVFSLLF